MATTACVAACKHTEREEVTAAGGIPRGQGHSTQRTRALGLTLNFLRALNSRRERTVASMCWLRGVSPRTQGCCRHSSAVGRLEGSAWRSWNGGERNEAHFKSSEQAEPPAEPQAAVSRRGGQRERSAVEAGALRQHACGRGGARHEDVRAAQVQVYLSDEVLGAVRHFVPPGPREVEGVVAEGLLALPRALPQRRAVLRGEGLEAAQPARTEPRRYRRTTSVARLGPEEHLQDIRHDAEAPHVRGGPQSFSLVGFRGCKDRREPEMKGARYFSVPCRAAARTVSCRTERGQRGEGLPQ